MMFKFSIVLTLLLSTISCATLRSTPEIVTVEPELLSFGHDGSVDVSFKATDDDLKLSILPGGPYVYAELALEKKHRALLVIEDLLWLLDSDNTLSRYTFNKNSGMFSIVDKTENVLAISRHNDALIVAFKNRVKISVNGKEIVFSLPESVLVKNIAFDQSTVCIADETGRVVSINRNDKKTLIHAPGMSINDISSVNGKCTILSKHAGLFSYENRDGVLTQFAHYQSNDFSLEMKNTANQLLIADANTGMSVLSLHENDFFWVGSYNKLGLIRQIDGDAFDAVVSDQNNTVSLINLEYEGTPRLVSDFRVKDNIRDLAWSQEFAYVLSDNKLQLIDFSSRSSPALSHLGVNLGGSRRSFIQGDIIYVADWFSGLHLYDISIANEPRLISSLHTPGSPKGVVVRGNIAFIADDDHGLQVADVSDKRRPVIIASLPLRGLAYTMKLIGNRLFLASHYGGLHIIDVTHVDKPSLLGTYDTPGKSWAVHVKGDLAYVADDDSGLLVFDISRPDRIRLINSFAPGGHAEDIVIRDNVAYVAFFEQGLYILDIKNPRDIKQIAHLVTPGNARGIDIVEDRLYLASWKAGLQIIDIKNLRKPKIVGHYDTRGSLWGLQVREPVLYGLDWWGGLKTIDVTNIERPRLIGKYQTAGTIERVAKKDNFLFLATGKRGLQVFEGSNALNPVWATGVATDGYARDIAIMGDTAYLGLLEGGFDLVDISKPFHAKWLKHIHQSVAANRLLISGDVLLTTDGEGSVSLFDISNTNSPSHLDTINVKVRDIVPVDKGFYLLTEEGDLSELSVNKLTMAGVLQNVFHFSQNIDFLAGDESYLYGLDKKTGLLQVFSRKERQLAQQTRLDAVSNASGIFLREQRLFISVPYQGVSVVNLEGPAAYVEMAYPSTHNIKHPMVSDAAILLAGDSILVSGERLPNVRITRSSNIFTLQIPKAMPTGAYHIKATTNAGSTFRHNAFKLGFKKPKKSSFTMEDLKRKLQQGDFKGKAP